MALNKVTFKFGPKSAYTALETHDEYTIYWCTDTKELFKGEELFGTGALASVNANGLLSAEDKKHLDDLVKGSITGITAADKSLDISDGEGEESHLRKVKVNISAEAENGLELADDGLFAASYTLIKDETAGDYAAVYHLKKTTADGTKTNIGEAINIPKDLVIQSGTLEIVSVPDEPYENAEVGDPYLDIVLNATPEKHIYIPVKGLVDLPAAGNGIEVDGNKVSVKLNPDTSNGLEVSADGLALDMATTKTPGAMSGADKLTLQGLPTLYRSNRYEVIGVFDDTRIKQSDEEIRIMFAPDSPFDTQAANGGESKDANKWYFGVRYFAPNDEVDGYKEGDKTVEGSIVHFDDAFSGTDQYGRKYSVVWYPAAHRDNESSPWQYWGDDSNAEKGYIGWWHTIEWYKGDTCIDSETIRINLSNAACHNETKPFYMNDVSIIWENME